MQLRRFICVSTRMGELRRSLRFTTYLELLRLTHMSTKTFKYAIREEWQNRIELVRFWVNLWQPWLAWLTSAEKKCCISYRLPGIPRISANTFSDKKTVAKLWIFERKKLSNYMLLYYICDGLWSRNRTSYVMNSLDT